MHPGVKGLPMLLLVLAAIGCYGMSLAPITWVVISRDLSQPDPRRRHGGGRDLALGRLLRPDLHLPPPQQSGSARPGRSGSMPLICVAGFLFIRARLPETKGKSLERSKKSWSD